MIQETSEVLQVDAALNLPCKRPMTVTVAARHPLSTPKNILGVSTAFASVVPDVRELYFKQESFSNMSRFM